MTEYTFYQIECNGKRYVGHTKDLKRRIKNHKYDSNTITRRGYTTPLYQYIRANGNWNSCQISTLEKCNFETKRDAEMREEYWRMEKDATLNSCRCYRSKEQKNEEQKERNKDWKKENQYKLFDWNLKNKEKLKQQKQVLHLEKRETELLRMKEYREKNKELIKQKQNQKNRQIKLKKKMLSELLHHATYHT